MCVVFMAFKVADGFIWRHRHATFRAKALFMIHMCQSVRISQLIPTYAKKIKM